MFAAQGNEVEPERLGGGPRGDATVRLTCQNCVRRGEVPKGDALVPTHCPGRNVRALQQAVEQGVKQIEDFIQKGDAARAELALKVLLQMDPENRHRKRLEKQVKGMR